MDYKIDTTRYSIVDIGYDPAKCYFSIDCPKKGQVHCYENCVRYWGTNYMLANCGLPNPNKWIKAISPEKCDIDSYKKLAEIRENIINLVIDPNVNFNLAIKSQRTGNGKSSWAIKILLRYFQDHVIRAYASDILAEDLTLAEKRRDTMLLNGQAGTKDFTDLLDHIKNLEYDYARFSAYRIDYSRRYGFFVYANNYLSMVKYRNHDNEAEITRLERISHSTDLLILDDIGISGMTNAERNILLSLIEYRMHNNLTTIVTYNLFDETAEEIFGARLADRLNDFHTVELFGKSRRGCGF
jgi:hypothetical protein